MATLQIRDFPDDWYEVLKERAKKSRRTLPAEALVVFEIALGMGNENARKKALAFDRIDNISEGAPFMRNVEFEDHPVELVREDRE